MSLLNRIVQKVQREIGFRLDGNRLARLVQAANRIPLNPGARHVMFFNASTRLEGLSQNAAFSILSAIALRGNGIPVHHFVCHSGMSRCVLGTSRVEPGKEPPCARCIAQSGRIFRDSPITQFQYHPDPQIQELIKSKTIRGLESFEFDDIPLGKLVLPSLRWVLRRHHLVDDEATRFLFREFILSAWNVVKNFTAALQTVKPDTIVMFNGQFFPEATARFIAQKQGIRVITHEVALQPLTCFFTDGEATAYPIDIPKNYVLRKSQNAQLDEYLEQRFQGNFSMAGIKFWPKMERLTPEFLERAQTFKQIVPIFTNVVFDTSQGHANVIFPEMFAWLDEVIKIIKDHPETFFVLRAHPDEGRKGKESQESVAAWAQLKKIHALKNVLFVDSGDPFSSYELIQRSKFVMVYNSTIGLEAAIMGAAVLCAGKARFTQLPTVFLPGSVSEFQKLAEKFLHAKNIPDPEEYKINARKFLYFQLFKTSLPYGEFLDADRQWRGFVHIRKFKLADLLSNNAPGVRAFLDGILKHKPFLLSD